MKKSAAILIITILSMGLFSFLKKDKKEVATAESAILGMVLLEDPNSFDLKGMIKELKTKWKLKVNDKDADSKAAVLLIGDYRVMLANIPAAIPEKEVEKTAEYNYLWENAVKETSKHKGHIILSIVNAGKDPIRENILYSKLALAVMNNSKSIGMYIGGRSLVLKKEFYDSQVDLMSELDLPLYIWIYFGLREENGKRSAYTYGLADFGKKEMEILDSDNSLEALSEMMFNMAHYVIASDVNLKHGETIGISMDQKLKITESKGRYLEGKTLKIDY